MKIIATVYSLQLHNHKQKNFIKTAFVRTLIFQEHYIVSLALLLNYIVLDVVPDLLDIEIV
jgi:hypothetical protein